MKYNSKKIIIFLSFAIIGIGLVSVSIYKSGLFNFSSSTASGFGISPPFINARGLKPGDVVKKSITILRNDAEDDKVVKLVLENKEISSWVKFPMGEEFVFKKGDTRMAFEVIITIPDYVSSGSFRSKLMVIMSANKIQGAVGIGLGAQVDIDLAVNGEENLKKNLINITNDGLYERLKGKIIIKTEDFGKAYYINPNSKTMQYLGQISQETRLAIQTIGIGINNYNFQRLTIKE